MIINGFGSSSSGWASKTVIKSVTVTLSANTSETSTNYTNWNSALTTGALTSVSSSYGRGLAWQSISSYITSSDILNAFNSYQYLALGVGVNSLTPPTIKAQIITSGTSGTVYTIPYIYGIIFGYRGDTGAWYYHHRRLCTQTNTVGNTSQVSVTSWGNLTSVSNTINKAIVMNRFGFSITPDTVLYNLGGTSITSGSTPEFGSTDAAISLWTVFDTNVISLPSGASFSRFQSQSITGGSASVTFTLNGYS